MTQKPRKIRRGLWEYRGLKIERYNDPGYDLYGLWDIIVRDETPYSDRCVEGPYRRLKHAVKSIDERLRPG